MLCPGLPNQLLVELASPIVQATEWVHVCFIDSMGTHYLGLKAVVEVPLKEKVLVCCLAGEPMNKDYGALVSPLRLVHRKVGLLYQLLTLSCLI